MGTSELKKPVFIIILPPFSVIDIDILFVALFCVSMK